MAPSLLIGAALGAAVAGAVLAVAAWQAHSMSLGLCGAALLLACPALAVAASPMNFGPVVAVDDILHPATTDRLHQTDRFLLAVRGTRAVALMGLSYAIVLWICQITGMFGARRFVAYYSLLSIAAVAIYFPWLSRPERTALAVRAELLHRLREFRSSRSWTAG
jgi:hypothetical protein